MASDGYLHGYQNYDIDMTDSDSIALARERAKLPKLSPGPSKAKPQSMTTTETLYQQFDSPASSSSDLYAMQLDPVLSSAEGGSALYSTAAGLYTQALEHSNMYLLREEPSDTHSFDPKPIFPSNPALGSPSGPIPSQPSYLQAGGHYSDSRALQNSGGYSTSVGRGYIPYSDIAQSDSPSNGYISAYSPSHAVNDSGYSTGAYLSDVDIALGMKETTTTASPKAVTETVKTKNVEVDAESNPFEQFIAECDARLLKEALLRFAGKINDKSRADENISLQSLLAEYKLLPKLPPLSTPMSQEEVDLKSNLKKAGLQASDPAMASIGNRNWNKEFQEIRDALLAFGDNRNVLRDPTHPDLDVRVQLDRLTRLQDDFYYAAKTYARIIISELSLPDSQKTIPPVNIGGVAGGAKYIMKGIMFKFALDQMIADKPKPVWMYGGNERNDRLAIKAAGKEFGALQIFVAMEVGLLRFPLQAMIDYKGYRLIAQVLLPIDKSTIIYGSNDSGRTVHTDVPEVNKMMQDLAKNMNLRGHKVGTHPSTSKMIYGPGDIEVHKGHDGHYYALDFGRLIPPEAPVTDPEVVAFERRSVFYKFLRFEHLLLECKVPLSSDSFSAWSMCDENRVENENNLREACQKLYQNIIPEFAAELDKIDLRVRPDATPSAYTDHLLMRVRLPARVRYYGINIRHLGRIRKHMTSPEHRKLVMSHCVARVVKRVLRDEMRIQMENMMGTPTEGPFRLVVTQVFNMVLGRAGGKSVTFWKYDVKEFLKRMYYYVLDENEADVEYDLRESVDMKALIIYALHGADVVLTPRALEELMQNINIFVMIENDVQELVPRVRQLYKSFMFNAMHKRLLALETSNRNTAMRLLTASYNTAVLATLTVPKCPITNLELAFILYCILSIQLDEHQAAVAKNSLKSAQSLREEIEKGFDTAFLRTEESIGTLPSASNINHWSRIALLFAKWKRSQGDPALAEQYEEKSKDVTRLSTNFSQGLTCSGALADSETIYRWKALGERLTSFRLSQVPSSPSTPFKPASIAKAKPANYSKLAIASFRGFTPIVSVNE